MTFDPTKPYACRNGNKAEAAPSLSGSFLIGAYVGSHDRPWPVAWFPDGRIYNNGRESPYDLVNIPEPSKAPERVWLYVNRSTGEAEAVYPRTPSALTPTACECVEYVRVQP